MKINIFTFWNYLNLLFCRWWVVVAGSIGVLIFMAMFIKCCAVHTPR